MAVETQSCDELAASWRGLLEHLGGLGDADLPATVADAAARLLADCLICAEAGAPLARSRQMRSALLGTHDDGEARVLGTSLRAPAPLAAGLNTEAMNLLDADDTFLNGAHFGGLVAAAALAEAEASNAAFERLLLGVAVGFEVAARTTLAAKTRPGMLAPGLMALGAAAASCVAGGGSPAALTQAVALAARMAPAPLPVPVAVGELTSLKYAPYAMLASTGVLAARMARAGYLADPAYVTASPGFFDGQASEVRTTHLAGPPEGDGWWITQTSFKPYPSFRVGHPAIDALREIARTSGLAAENVEAIEIDLDPRALYLPFHAKAATAAPTLHLLPMHAQMNLPLALALAFLDVPPGPLWADPAWTDSPRTRAVMRKVQLCVEPIVSMQQLAAEAVPQSDRVRNCYAEVRLTAGGRTWTARRDCATGDPWSTEAPPDWTFLARKAESFCGSSAIVDRVRDRSLLGR